MKKKFFQFFFWLFGWKTIGDKPRHDKYILVVAPHTSNIDFFVALAARHIFDIRSHYLAKHTLFKIPIVGWFLKAIGGHAVDRTKKMNIVDQVVAIYDQQEKFAIAIAPEGSRSYRPEWKTGFYWIAEKAKIPIYMVGLDYQNKQVEIREPFMVTGDVEKDIEMMKAYYRTIKGRHPKKGVR